MWPRFLSNGMVPEIMKSVLDITEKLLSPEPDILQVKQNSNNEIWYESPSCLGSKRWTFVPDDYENLTSLEEFKAKIETWVAENTK